MVNRLRVLLPKTVDTIDVPCYFVINHRFFFFFFLCFSNPVLLVLEHINSLSYFFNASRVKIGGSNHREAY